MKKHFCFAALMYSALLGTAYALELFLNTNTATGFLMKGSSVWRYVLLMPALLLCFLTGLYVPKKQPCGLSMHPGAQRLETWLYLPAALAATVYGALRIVAAATGQVGDMSEHHAIDLSWRNNVLCVLEGVCAALFLVLAVWCLMRLFACHGGYPSAPWTKYLGLLGGAAFYLHAVICFIGQPSSLHRLAPAVTMLAALSSLLFASSLMRAVYLPEECVTAPPLARSGLLAFCCCTCLALPQMIWQQVTGALDVSSIALVSLQAAMGVLGAVCAWRIAKRPPRERRAKEPEPEPAPEVPPVAVPEA